MNQLYTCYQFYLMLVLMLFFGCSQEGENDPVSNSKTNLNYHQTIFEEIPGNEVGITFQNTLKETKTDNYFNFMYVYNGGGVALGDINNDGLLDVYFTGNQVENKLFINKGNLQFEDITLAAGVAGGNAWSNGVNMVDVNQDGYLDIYVCRGGNKLTPVEKRTNLLYINNQNETFTESASKYGLADSGFSMHSVFSDFDLDGDLDMALTSHCVKDFGLDYKAYMDYVSKPSDKERLKYFTNNGNNSFVEVAIAKGLKNQAYNLGLAAADMNEDQYPDLLVTNDFFPDDLFYLNQKGQGFSEITDNVFSHSSFYSMGIDVADINNDKLVDVLIAEMNPEDNLRQKANMSSMNPQDFFYRLSLGFSNQYMRNTLQINNGNGSFSEIGQLAGIGNTDWSWAPLCIDFDNDGWKDIYITNGFLKDVLDRDAQKQRDKLAKENGGQLDWKQAMEVIGSYKRSSYVFRNNHDLTFEKANDTWGIQKANFSNGAAYGDLDNDGDLDLIINNINAPATLIKNQSRQKIGSNFIQFELEGSPKNKGGYGAKIEINHDGNTQFIEHNPSRGYLSTVSPVVHFGIGSSPIIEEVLITWPNGKKEKLTSVKANQKIKLSYSKATNLVIPAPNQTLAFLEVAGRVNLNYTHVENDFNDYDDQILLPHKMSHFGPTIAKGDINNDGEEDFFIGGAAGKPGQLFVQNSPMNFTAPKSQPWNADAKSEDLGALFFDANNDGFDDLYVVSGGNAFKEEDKIYQDRIYLNDKKGNFSKANILPKLTASGGAVTAGDFDKDGDMDLFVGGRLTPKKYLKAPESYILLNENGKFVNATQEICPELANIGMVSTATWEDYNQDGNMDLIISGEWMDILVFQGDGKKLINKTKEAGLAGLTGWWNKLKFADFDKDGDLDLVAGNLGLNYKYKASPTEPFKAYCNDFDNNGKWDIVLGYFQNGVEFPLRGKHCSSDQLPEINEKFPTYTEFGKANIQDVYGEKLEGAISAEATHFASTYFENKNGVFEAHPLPNEAQMSPIFGMETKDFNGDGHLDIVAAGNFFVAEVETGVADASIGVFLKGNGKGQFKAETPRVAGLNLSLDARDLAIVHSSTKNTLLLVANNNGPMQVYGFSRKY